MVCKVWETFCSDFVSWSWSWSRTKHTILLLCNVRETFVHWFCFLTTKCNVVFDGKYRDKKDPQWKKIMLTMKLTFGGIFIFMKYIFLLITLNLNVLNAVFEFPAQLAGIWNSLKLSIVEIIPVKQRVLGERDSGCGRWRCYWPKITVCGIS